MSTSPRQPLRALALAFLLAFTALGIVTPHSEAANTAKPSATLQVFTEPFANNEDLHWSTGVDYLFTTSKANSGDPSGQHNVRVRSNADHVINRVDFIWRLIDSNCQTSGSPIINPCSSVTGVVWDADRSYAPGWTVSADNRAKTGADYPPVHVLSFTKGVLLPLGTQYPDGYNANSDTRRDEEFHIAFKILGSPVEGMQIPIQVAGYPGSDSCAASSPCPAEYDTTCSDFVCGPQSLPNPSDPSFFMVIDNTRPAILQDLTTNPTTPHVGIITRDTDYNGHLDMLEITFAENLDVRRFDARDFHVLAQKGREFPTGQEEYRILSWYFEDYSLSGDHYTNRVNLRLEEAPFYDTGDIPRLSYSVEGAPAVYDLAGNPMRSFSATAYRILDGAKPVMVGAWGVPGESYAHVFFSEPVRGSGKDANGNPDGRILLSDLIFLDDGGDSNGGNEMMCIQATSPCDITSKKGAAYSSIQFVPHDLKLSDRFTLLADMDPGHPGYRYTIGALDGHPVTGDLIGSARMATPPATCPIAFAPVDHTKAYPLVQVATVGDPAVPFTDEYPAAYTMPPPPGATAPCYSDTLIKDLNGLTLFYDSRAVQVNPSANRHLTYPLATKAQIDISHDRITLTFNGPVHATPYDGRTAEPLGSASFDIESAQTADPNAGVGPQGIAELLYSKADSDTVILRTDAAARAVDVSNNPARLVVKCGAIEGASGLNKNPVETSDKESYSTHALVPCDDPDRFGAYDGLVTPHIDLVDTTPPRVLAASTVDADHDGYLDGIRLTFTEPVNDRRFRESSAETYELSCIPDAAAGTGPEYCSSIEPTLVEMSRMWDPEYKARDCFGPFVWSTGDVVNDNTGILSAVQVSKQGDTGAVVQRTRDCHRLERGVVRTDRPLPTDYLPSFLAGFGLIEDQATPANALPQYCGQRSFACPDHADVQDGAPPVIMDASTVDSPAVDKDGIAQPDPTLNVYGDGFIDGYRLRFSEPVSDASFHVLDFKVGGTTAKDRAYTLLSNMRTADLADPNLDTLRVDDQEITLLFEKGPAPDTDARPQLTYTLDPSRPGGSGILDHAGNAMVTIGPDGIIERDGARPQIVSVHGFVGTNLVNVTFSEPVDDGAKNVLVQADFQYSNVNQAGAAGKSGSKEVCHGDNTPSYPTPNYDDPNTAAIERCDAKPLKYAIMPLESPLTADDIAQDRLQALPNRIFEIAPSVAVKQSVPDLFHGLAEAVDVTPPGAITDLRVIDPSTTANSVVLAWTAPGDDGQSGTPAGYEFRIAPVAVNQGNFASITNPAGLSFEYSPGALAAAGATQTVRVIGLAQETQYHFVARALDEGGNRGGVSPDVTATTTRDLTPPTSTPVISSKDFAANSVSTLHAGAFTWTPARDQESTVVYRYALNHNPDYLVLSTDPATSNLTMLYRNIDDGDWTFHVAGFSAGGSTSTAHYTFAIGAQAVSVQSIQDANDLVHVRAVRSGGYNTVNWTLPDPGAMPKGVLEGIEIWRNDDGLPKLVAVIPGSYDDLRVGNFTDTTLGATKDSQYRIDMLFATNQRQSDPISGYTAVTNLDPASIPAWVLALVAVAAALVVAGIVIFVVLRRKQKEAAAGGLAYSWESASPDALGIDQATGLPLHNVKCPTCATPFQAVGKTPLALSCPNCATTGTLD